MSNLPSTKPDVTLSLRPASISSLEASLKPEERGIKLIQLLLSCANHASSGNLHRADASLLQISQLASVTGDSIQRLASWFASALAVRLVKRWPGLHKSIDHGRPDTALGGRVWSIFTQAFPYLKFSFAIMSNILFKTLYSERVIHIINLGSGDLDLWVPLLQKLAHLPNGPPHLKITCVATNKVVVDKLGIRLSKEAETLDMPFQYNPVNVRLRELTIDMLKVKTGEAVAVASVLSLHVLLAEDDRVEAHFGMNKSNGVKGGKQLEEFLTMVKSIKPKIVLLVEQESDHNLNRLVDRFVEALHYHSAIFDSIDATFGGSSSEERVLLEDMFGKQIENIVACEGLDREERHERYVKWAVRFTNTGFRPVRLWYDAVDEAKRLVESCGLEGYMIVNQRASLMICWHDRPLYCVSAWIYD